MGSQPIDPREVSPGASTIISMSSPNNWYEYRWLNLTICASGAVTGSLSWSIQFSTTGSPITIAQGDTAETNMSVVRIPIGFQPTLATTGTVRVHNESAPGVGPAMAVQGHWERWPALGVTPGAAGTWLPRT